MTKRRNERTEATPPATLFESTLDHIALEVERARALLRDQHPLDAISILTTSVESLGDLAPQLVDQQPATMLSTAAHLLLAEAYLGLDDRDRALAAAGRALHLISPLAQSQPAEDEAHLQRAFALRWLGQALCESGRLEDAVTALEHAVHSHRRVADTRRPEAIASLATCFELLSDCYQHIGETDGSAGALRMAIRHWQRALDLDATTDYNAHLERCRSQLHRRSAA